jgi:hypothetical protein
VLARASLLFVAVITPPLSLVPWTEAERRAGAARPRLVRASSGALGVGLVLLLNGGFNFMNTGLFVPVILVSDTVTRMNHEGSTGAFAEAAGDDGVISVWDVVRQAEAEIDARRGGASRWRDATNSKGEARSRGPGGSSDASRSIEVDLWTLARNAPRKIASTLRDVETTHDYGYYGERSELRSWVLSPLSFGALAILAAFGAYRDFRRGRRVLALVAPLVSGIFLTTTLFYPTSRYRLPIALAFVLLAAPFVVDLARDAREGRRRVLACALVVLCFGLGVRLEGYRLEAPERWHMRVAESAFITGDVATYRSRVARARAMAPNDPDIERLVSALERWRPSAEPSNEERPGDAAEAVE